MKNSGASPPGIAELADEDILVNSRQLRRMLPVHDMTIRRWEENPAVGFPKRIKLNGGHVFWRLAAVRAWITEREQSLPKGL